MGDLEMVNSVSALSRSLATLRIALANARPVAHKGRSARTAATAQGASGADAPLGELALLPKRLAELTGDPAARQRQAVRLFVRAVLLDEFGPQVQPAPDLDALIERTASHLETSEEFTALIVEAASELLPGSKGR